MTDAARVAGVMVVRDEWPLLAVSATHLLCSHVERLWVFDHASTDATPEGLRRLGELFGDRLVVERLDDVPFLQEAIVTVALDRLREQNVDWFLVADADEFPIAGPAPLAGLLADLDPRVGLARYDVENWVAPRDFDRVDPRRLGEIRRRARPVGSLPDAAVNDDPDATFFDRPFRSKVLVRRGTTAWLSAGAHGARNLVGPVEQSLAREQFHVAHLPLLSRERLELRAAQGRRLAQAGLPIEHGWQSHLVRRSIEENTVDDFWRRHSAAGDEGPAGVDDDALALSLRPALEMLASHPHVLAAAAGGPRRASVTAADVLGALHRLQQSIDVERDGLLAQSAEQARQRAELALALATCEEALRRAARDREDLLASRTWRLGRALARLARLGRG